jgi:hypothetical protein
MQHAAWLTFFIVILLQLHLLSDIYSNCFNVKKMKRNGDGKQIHWEGGERVTDSKACEAGLLFHHGTQSQTWRVQFCT